MQLDKNQILKEIQEFHPGARVGIYSHLGGQKDGVHFWNHKALEATSVEDLKKLLTHMRINKKEAEVNLKRFEQAREDFFTANPDLRSEILLLKTRFGDPVALDAYEAWLNVFNRKKFEIRMRDRILYGFPSVTIPNEKEVA